MEFYLITMAVVFASDAIFVLGLNLQFGLTGIINLGYIMFYAIGAYIAGVLTLGSASSPAAKQLVQTYILGAHLPYPLPALGALVAAGLLAVPVGLIALRSTREDLAALVTVGVFLVVWIVIGNDTPIFNGYNGLIEIPRPFHGIFGWSAAATNWLYVLVAFVWVALSYWASNAILHAPLGRTLRAIRENPEGAESLGKSVFWLRLLSFVVGSAFAGLAGAILVQYTTTWAPTSWSFPETIVAYSALIVGGRGNNRGAILGAFLVPVVIGQAVLFLPQIGGGATLLAALQWIGIGVLTLLFLWFRPGGLVPERKTDWRPLERLRQRAMAAPPAGVGEAHD